jgi:hypothetical protein
MDEQDVIKLVNETFDRKFIEHHNPINLPESYILERFASIESKLEKNSNDIAELKNSFAMLGAKIDSSIITLDAKIDSRITALDAKIDSRITALDAKIDSRITALDAKIDSSVTALDAKIDSSVTALDAKIDSSVTILDNKITALRSELLGSISTNNRMISALLVLFSVQLILVGLRVIFG